MPEQNVLALKDLPAGAKKTVKIDDTEILLLNHDGTILAVEAKCPHAGAPLEKGAICNGRLVCPWHMGTFALGKDAPLGALLEPPPLRALKTYPARIDGENILASSEPLPAVTERRSTIHAPSCSSVLVPPAQQLQPLSGPMASPAGSSPSIPSKMNLSIAPSSARWLSPAPCHSRRSASAHSMIAAPNA